MNGATWVDMRVCKLPLGSNFSNAIHIRFQETARGNSVLLDKVSDGSNSNCTPWENLGGLSAWQEDDQLGGVVRVVSPSSCANQWNNNCSNDPGCGHCWLFQTDTMTRTCK